MAKDDQNTTQRKNDGIILQQVIATQLKDLRVMGIFLASTARVEQEASRINALFEIINICLEVAREFNFPDPSLTGCPVVYNRTLWKNDKLCGYIGNDFQVSGSEVVASRRDLWQFAVRYPERLKAHFLKCALWFTQNHGNDYRAGLSFLLDLFAEGLFVKPLLFTDTINSFARHYALGVDLSFLERTKVFDSAQINERLSNITQQYENVLINFDRFNEIVSSAIDLILDRVERVYQAPTLDDWIIGQSSLYAPTMWLSFMFANKKALELSTTNLVMLSRFDEMSADIFASVMFRLDQARVHWPPKFHLEEYEDLAAAYREEFRDGSWLDRLTEDRLVIHDGVREFFRQTGSTTFHDVALPEKYALPSAQIAMPFCIAYGRDPALTRTVDFDSKQIASQLLAMGVTERADESKIVAARQQLLKEEARMVAILVKQLPRFSSKSFQWVFEMRELYPWHPVLCRESAKFLPPPTDLGDPASCLNQCVALEPTNPDNWLAIAKQASRGGFDLDGAALSKIASRIDGA
jgi:hypothetical protein